MPRVDRVSETTSGTGEIRCLEFRGDGALIGERMVSRKARHDAAADAIPPYSGLRFRWLTGPSRAIRSEPAFPGGSLSDVAHGTRRLLTVCPAGPRRGLTGLPT